MTFNRFSTILGAATSHTARLSGRFEIESVRLDLGQLSSSTSSLTPLTWLHITKEQHLSPLARHALFDEESRRIVALCFRLLSLNAFPRWWVWCRRFRWRTLAVEEGRVHAMRERVGVKGERGGQGQRFRRGSGEAVSDDGGKGGRVSSGGRRNGERRTKQRPATRLTLDTNTPSQPSLHRSPIRLTSAIHHRQRSAQCSRSFVLFHKAVEVGEKRPRR